MNWGICNERVVDLAGFTVSVLQNPQFCFLSELIFSCPMQGSHHQSYCFKWFQEAQCRSLNWMAPFASFAWSRYIMCNVSILPWSPATTVLGGWASASRGDSAGSCHKLITMALVLPVIEHRDPVSALHHSLLIVPKFLVLLVLEESLQGLWREELPQIRGMESYMYMLLQEGNGSRASTLPL